MPDAVPMITRARCDQLLSQANGRGVLLLSHDRNRAAELLLTGCDAAVGEVRDRRAFSTVLAMPQIDRLTDSWQHIILLDSGLPGEVDLLRQRCPNAKLYRVKASAEWLAQLKTLVLDRTALGRLYQRITAGAPLLQETLAADTGLTQSQTFAGLIALKQSGLIEFAPSPWRVSLCPRPAQRLGQQASPVNSPIMQQLRCISGQKP